MQTKQLDTKPERDSGSVHFREKWLQELRRARRSWFYETWTDKRHVRKIPEEGLLRRMRDDLEYALSNGLNLLLNLRKYGALIKKEYGLSYSNQLYRLTYLVFVMRTQAMRFRMNLLFDDARWKKVNNYAFSIHFRVQNRFLGSPAEEVRQIIENKLRFSIHCKQHGIPTPEILAAFIKGNMTTGSKGNQTFPKSDLFMKEITGGLGLGAKKFRYENGSYLSSDGKKYAETELQHFFADYSRENRAILIQKSLKNHDSWKSFTAGGLATCRVVTGLSSTNENEIVAFFATMKMPTGNSIVDNFSKGCVASSIDLETGVMSRGVASIPRNGAFEFDYHPDTGQRITGEKLPFLQDLLEITKRAHLHFNAISIGWDVAFTEEGVSILEGNLEWGTDVMEGPSGTPIADTVYMDWFDGWVRKQSP